MVGVVGSYGKTTSAWLTRGLFEQQEDLVGMIGGWMGGWKIVLEIVDGGWWTLLGRYEQQEDLVGMVGGWMEDGGGPGVCACVCLLGGRWRWLMSARHCWKEQSAEDGWQVVVGRMDEWGWDAAGGT